MQTVFYLAMIPLGTGFCFTYAARRWFGRLAALVCCALSLTSVAMVLWQSLWMLIKPPMNSMDWGLSGLWAAVTVLLSAGCFLGLWLASRHLQRQVEIGTGITRQ